MMVCLGFAVAGAGTQNPEDTRHACCFCPPTMAQRFQRRVSYRHNRSHIGHSITEQIPRLSSVSREEVGGAKSSRHLIMS